MAVYRLPDESPYTKPFRIFAAVVVLLLAIVLFISIYDPLDLSDKVRHLIGGAAIAILAIAVAASFVMAGKSGLWKLRQTYLIELSEDKLTQARSGWPAVEIPLAQIESMQLKNGWLIVRGAEPKRRILVPTAVEGFDGLRQELTAYGAIVPTRSKVRLLSITPLVLGIVAYFLLFTSRQTGLVIAAGAAALLIQGETVFVFWRMWRAKKVSNLSMILLGAASLAIVWIIFARIEIVF